MKINPSYLELYKSGELFTRVNKAKDILKDCIICPHNCHVDRTSGELGFCKAGYNPIIYSYAPHFGEERVLVGKGGSGTIFFGRCNLNCVYCQNWTISQPREDQFNKIYETNTDELSNIMVYLQERGCENINFVSPTHFIPQILEAINKACDKGLNLPLVYNSGGYDAIDTLRLLDGVFDIYLPDFKYTENAMGKKYSRIPNYFDMVKTALKEMYRQVGNLEVDGLGVARKGLIIRHLVLPNEIAGSLKALRFIYEELSPYTTVNIMMQYRPCFEASLHTELSSFVKIGQYNNILSEAREMGLRNVLND
jgi:putative pyruvate formate lyase activating enzyme